MARDEDLVQRVRAALSTLDDVGERRMFGSTAFLVRGKLAIAARPDRLMCRIHPALEEAALKRDGSHLVVMRGRPMRGYLHVEAASVSTARALKYWVDRVLAYNEALTVAVSDD
jgi:TfoX/Sxy family transcriptional regulator of competence genes